MQDDDVLTPERVSEEAERLVTEAKKDFELGKAKASREILTEAAFKAEQARAKYQAIQEITRGDRQKSAGEQIRAVNELIKLINDARAASPKPPDPPPNPPPAEPNPATPKPEVKPAVPEPARPARRPQVPELAKQQEAEKTVREVFKGEYSKKATQDLRVFARNLIDEAARSADNLPMQWVLLREAREMAAQSGDAAIAIEAVDKMVATFDVEGLILKTAALSLTSKTAKTPEDFSSLAEQYLVVAIDAIAADAYETADKASAAAAKAGRRANNSTVVTRATVLTKEIAEIKSRYSSAKKAAENLIQNPRDTQSRLELGRFHCFWKGDWEVGLPHLAKSRDKTLQTLAVKDFSRPTTIEEQVAVGDAWWEIAEKEKGLAQNRIRRRAAHWYGMALPQATGIVKTKLEKRVEEAAGQPESNTRGGINLLKLIEISKDTVNGDWSLSGDSLVSPETPFGCLQIPFAPPQEYDLRIVVVRKSGVDAFCVGLVGGERQFRALLDGYGGGTAGFDLIDGKGSKDNETARKLKALEVGKPKTLVYSVRKDRVSVSVDGKTVLDWKADYSRVSPYKEFAAPEKRAMSLGTYESRFQITQLVLLPISGQGKRIR